MVSRASELISAIVIEAIGNAEEPRDEYREMLRAVVKTGEVRLGREEFDDVLGDVLQER